MKPVTLIIMDGFGESDEIEGNAIASAKTPNIDRLKSSYPFTTIGAAGLDVGLPPGQMGNSEVGHLNLGAGGSSIRTTPGSTSPSRTALFIQTRSWSRPRTSRRRGEEPYI